MNNIGLKKILEQHGEWLKDIEKGKRANLSGVNLSIAKLSDVNLRGANLSGANLSNANLSYVNLSGANLSGADLIDADLGGADLHDANLSGANLRGVNLGIAKLSDVNLRGANLRGANLRGANLRGAVLSGADLSNAVLIDADLHDANLSCANLIGANLIGVKGLPEITKVEESIQSKWLKGNGWSHDEEHDYWEKTFRHTGQHLSLELAVEVQMEDDYSNACAPAEQFNYDWVQVDTDGVTKTPIIGQELTLEQLHDTEFMLGVKEVSVLQPYSKVYRQYNNSPCRNDVELLKIDYAITHKHVGWKVTVADVVAASETSSVSIEEEG